jgi:hypothetical protein
MIPYTRIVTEVFVGITAKDMISNYVSIKEEE